MRRLWASALAAVVFAAGCDNMAHQSSLRTEAVAPRAAPSHVVEFRAGGAGPKPALTRGLLQRGRSRFNAACSVCHGADGYGRGIVVRRGFPQPPSFHEARLRSAPDAELLRAIEQGYGVMYPANDRVPVEDRWAVVAYIRALQLSQHASRADVPAEMRPALESQ